MELLVKLLDNHDFIIVNYATKIELLKLRKTYPWLNFKVVTREEVIDEFLGASSLATLKYIIEKYNYTYDHAKVVNDNIIFKNYSNHNAKLKTLTTIRQALLRDGLLMGDFIAKTTYANKKILLSSEYSEDPLLTNLLTEAKAQLTFIPQLNNYKPIVHKFTNGIDEIYFTLNEIAALLDNGVLPENIKLFITDQNYVSLISQLAMQFNIQIEPRAYSLFDHPTIYNLYETLLTDMPKFLEIINDENPSNVIIAFKNVYLNIDPQDVPAGHFNTYLKAQLLATSYREETLNGIEIIRQLPLFSSPETHYFYLNFVEGNTPARAASSPFLTNSEKDLLGILNDEIVAKCHEKALISAISNIKSVHLSFTEVFVDAEFKPSNLVRKLELTIPKGEPLPHIFYSQNYLNYVTSKRRDELESFNALDEMLSFYYFVNQQRDDYKSFDYTFKPINYQSKPVTLSYSKINTYQSLPFDYFAKYLLGLTEDGESEHIRYGNFVHNVLEHSTDEASFKFSFSQFLDNDSFSAKERFFIENTAPLIYLAFENYMHYIEMTKPSVIHNEIELSATINNNIKLIGRVDRLLEFTANDQKYGMIIDFKTGSTVSNREKYQEGLDLQLPLYGVLLQNADNYQDITPIALVLNQIKAAPYVLDNEESLLRYARNALKFKGLLLGEMDMLALIEKDLSPSPYFTALRLTKDGNLRGVVTAEEFTNYLKIAETKVIETYDGIMNNEFPVKVKHFGRENSGRNSSYKHISYLPIVPDSDNAGDDDE